MIKVVEMLAHQFADIRWAVRDGVITKEQYQEFTGKEYTE